FLIRTVVTQWSQITAYSWEFRAVPLIGSMVVQVAAMFFWAAIWRSMIVRSGNAIGRADGVRIYLVSNLAKYIPGSIWGYVSRVYLGEDEGLTAAGVGVSVVWEVGMAIVASLILTATTIPTYPGEIPDAILNLVLLVALVCFIGLIPPVSNRWLRLLNRWQSTHPTPTFRWSDFFFYLTAALATHVLVGTAFFMFTRSLVNVNVSAWWSFVGMWSFSATAGLVVIFVPYGLGVKEGLLTLLLQPFLPAESAVLISLASRLWTIACELLAAGIVAVLFYGSKRLASRRVPGDPANTLNNP
ncbi:MAG TPA: lysylphosphatidylglycerol synthase domain-containing protein, partial [Anaerolineae bacterium]|nr:lysylphosphatidylglycerol synthase domain-containing protein [Anaerolineae bacterium]